MDSSSSLTSIQFLQIKNFTANGLLKRFTQTKSIATVSFADNVEIVTDFGELNSDKILMYNSNRDYHTRIDYAIGIRFQLITETYGIFHFTTNLDWVQIVGVFSDIVITCFYN